MTWEELKEEAKKMGYEECDIPGCKGGEDIFIEGFEKNGNYFNELGDFQLSKLKPEQMLMIMSGLE